MSKTRRFIHISGCTAGQADKWTGCQSAWGKEDGLSYPPDNQERAEAYEKLIASAYAHPETTDTAPND